MDEKDDATQQWSDDEEFEDAPDSIPPCTEMDLHEAVRETTISLNLFLNNKFSEAKAKMQPWADRSVYHATGYGTILYIQATMTFESADIEAAVVAVKRSIQVCQRHRKKTSFASALAKIGKHQDYNSYTNSELHAEVCYAENLLERALLTFIQDENLINFVKGSLKIRACYQAYKECMKILEKRQWKDAEDEKVHFESGVLMGLGMFNLMISLLPTKILKLVEFVGFSGDKKKGLRMLEQGSALLSSSLRGPMCSMTLLGYHTVVTYVLGTGDGDIDKAEQLLQPCLKLYPKGAMFLFFAGRIEEIRGNIPEAIVRFEESVDSQEEWRQFHHLCFWELMWCHSFLSDWLLAMKYAEKLCKESRWSRSTYMYQKASFLMMCDDQSDETLAHITYLYGEVPKLKQRIAGKSIPMEKLAVAKAKRYTEQGNKLTLPALELIYVWNGFSIIGKKKQLLEPMLTVVEDTLNKIVENKDQHMYYHDDYCLTLLLKGVCLRWWGQEFQSEQCFREIFTLEKKLKQDAYLVPYAMVELALLLLIRGDVSEAKTMLDKAKSHYKGYHLESRLHFRIHSANLKINSPPGSSAENSVTDVSPPASPSSALGTPLLQCSVTSDAARNGACKTEIDVEDRL